ncbi:hypothetical protein OG897_40150 [Streptomyces sp. NBC_00237]|uniref:hypothetical protein n=1 Tax=Streptomyces sp. NBC_00237 TaxID=2975687 RepID=UPI0022585A58|nr:hypothetical protein [Streptomyces sp. NBC_00237]MCX5207605.1 hypothetical protein [Streptomyces sp. NBC_00237]
MALHRFEVDVPIHSLSTPALTGVHVFVGLADSPATALRRAHEAYDAALTAQQTGQKMPGMQAGDWGARGLRTGWELEWPAATTSYWNSPVNLLNPR